MGLRVTELLQLFPFLKYLQILNSDYILITKCVGLGKLLKKALGMSIVVPDSNFSSKDQIIGCPIALYTL